MGMVIEGHWVDDADERMQAGRFQRAASPLPDRLDPATQTRLAQPDSNLVLIVSESCPWSHAVTLARHLKGLGGVLPLEIAGGPRTRGYRLDPNGSLARGLGIQHLYQIYTESDPGFTGRATIPVLFDRGAGRILSNASNALMIALDAAGAGASLYPEKLRDQIDAMIATNYAELTNAVYRAGLAQRQDEYQAAADLVFGRLAALEKHLHGRQVLVGDGDALTLADLRLFACLVRFDTVYATHFRCTRHRLTEFPRLWRYTRAIYNRPGIAETVNFEAIRAGYYLNDGETNPHGILPDQPVLDWSLADATGA